MLPKNINVGDVSEYEFYDAIVFLNPSKVMGTDEIDPQVLKYCAEDVPVHHHFYVCFFTGTCAL